MRRKVEGIWGITALIGSILVSSKGKVRTRDRGAVGESIDINMKRRDAGKGNKRWGRAAKSSVRLLFDVPYYYNTDGCMLHGSG